MAKGQRTRSQILSVAVQVVRETGLRGLSIGGLAAETGLSKSGLFAHFGSKEALQLETLKAAAEEFSASVVIPGRAQLPGLAELRALSSNWFGWAEATGGCPFVGASSELDDDRGPVRDYVVWVQGEWLKLLARAAERAVSLGQFRHDLDTRQFSFDVYAVMLGFHHAHRLIRDPAARRHAEAGVERVIRSSI